MHPNTAPLKGTDAWKRPCTTFWFAQSPREGQQGEAIKHGLRLASGSVLLFPVNT